MNKRIWIGVAVSLAFIYFIIWQPHLIAFLKGRESFLDAFFGSPRFNFAELWRVLGSVRVEYVIASFLLHPIHILIRSHRWSVMLRPLRSLRLMDSISIQMIGYFANTALPFRAGEFIRGILLGRRVNLPISSSLATVFTERVIDTASLLLLAAIVGFFYPFPELIAKGALMMGIVVLFGVAVIIYIVLSPNPLKWLPNYFLRLIPGKMGVKIRGVAERFTDGFVLPVSPAGITVFVAETILLWLMYAFQGLLMLKAFRFDDLYAAIGSAPIMAAFVILVINAIGLSIPSAPGGIGTFHAICIFGLALFSVPTEAAAGYALVIHGLSMVFFLVGGLPFIWREGLQISQLQRVEEQIELKQDDER